MAHVSRLMRIRMLTWMSQFFIKGVCLFALCIDSPVDTQLKLLSANQVHFTPTALMVAFILHSTSRLGLLWNTNSHCACLAIHLLRPHQGHLPLPIAYCSHRPLSWVCSSSFLTAARHHSSARARSTGGLSIAYIFSCICQCSAMTLHVTG